MSRPSEARAARKTMTAVRFVVVAAWLVAWLAVSASAGCGSSSGPPGHPSQAPASAHPDDSCVNDHDCTFADDCCNCNAGGRRLAIRKDALAEFMASQPQRCGEVVCPQVISHDVSCQGPAICGNLGHCRPAAGNALP